ncbi:AGR098Wp [Eremothecium gossypii ATCC 10895]|uniref:AGR098Wp n=1 Tax=Eremothecium gossypii (strain ATCC 10895 / CBS 109.51 / FGSC 9923 / NRRL Y-1056) TaxID=284811 RepID=Q74ZV0_EREGS|nr:AGR098Wp [Eremothecium gossypii ATCC 10895]AAS54588.1 AGR098Wp [Eremothecium gossypii ATCC 10895]AEY98919.1 FAGR098Wp [Eremothecium gossypii FDAG1]
MATSVDENFHQIWAIPSALNLKNKTLNSPTINPLRNGTASQYKPPASILLPNRDYNNEFKSTNSVLPDAPKNPVLDEQTDEIVKYIRKPDPLAIRTRERSISNLSLLTPLNSTYIPESPGLRPDRIDRSLFEGSSMLEPRLVRSFKKCKAPKLLPDTAALNLAILGKPLPGYDIVPLRESDNISNRTLDTDDNCEKKCLAILYSELNGGDLPPFKKELELNEKAEMVHWYDYALYKLFGIDRCGYFTLKAEKRWYQLHPWALLDQDTDDYSVAFGVDDDSLSEADDMDLEEEEFEDFMQRSDLSSILSLDRYLS